MDYALTAQDTVALSTPDSKGLLPLHRALGDNVCLGIIKLLILAYPAALKVPNSNGDSILHAACLGGNCGAVKYLVEMNTRFVSVRNADNKLPIQLLFENESVDNDM